ncbi:MAG: hypothetical protein LBM60_02075 [Clostridium sp.]|jgi:dephospho-CoA kinase|nr:hypothetical protein [Clostridium sp.]
MRKLIIVINGRGGVGKDSVCDVVAKYYNTINISSITPIKEVASIIGWDGEKNEHSRRFLSELKAVVTRFNDLPNRYLLEQARSFLDDSIQEVLFVQIREPEEIKHFRDSISYPTISILIKRKGIGDYDNPSDDNVEEYGYDYIYENDGSFDKLEEDFIAFFQKICKDSGV